MELVEITFFGRRACIGVMTFFLMLGFDIDRCWLAGKAMLVSRTRYRLNGRIYSEWRWHGRL